MATEIPKTAISTELTVNQFDAETFISELTFRKHREELLDNPDWAKEFEDLERAAKLLFGIGGSSHGK